MLLNNLLTKLQFEKIQGSLDKQVQSIAYNSNEVTEKGVFVAITGFMEDGHHYISEAIKQGATVIILEKNIMIEESQNVTVLKVENSREALALITNAFYSNPGDNLHLIGITGTNGKTSTTYLLKSIFESAERSFSLIGTNGTIINNKKIENKTTTPEALELQQLLSEINQLNISTCMMEVSSHALELSRVDTLNFDIGIFMNLTPDHLEMHKTMEGYFQAKAKLFDLTNRFNIINVDDPYGKRLVKDLETKEAKTVTFGINEDADIYPTNIEYSFNQTSFTVHTPVESADITVNIPGKIYLYNSLAAIATAVCSDIPMDFIQKGFAQIEHIKGRLELVYNSSELKVIIDFAHTEDALKNVLETIRPFVTGRLILVFGVYADMSESGKHKRIGMGKVAAHYADFSVVTSDNPKMNDAEQILQEISVAVEKYDGNYKAILDRKDAIDYAVQMAEENDVILIAGKGHETSQIIGTEAIPFSEKEIVLEAINRKKLK